MNQMKHMIQMNTKKTPSIKICGLRDENTIAAMDGLPITEVGLVFAPSKRKVTIEQGAKFASVIRKLRCRDGLAPRAAGVFVNLELTLMQELLQQVPLQIIQLHGQEPLSYYAELKENFAEVAIWKVISVKFETETSEHELDVNKVTKELMPFAPYIEAILLDAPGGGTGKSFNWKAIETYKQAASSLNKDLIVAGGLHEGNVGTLLEQYQIDGVDVSSGVETEGVKDIEKIKQFVRKVIEA